MKKVIHHLRRQPEHIKRIVLHILIVAFAFILILLWIYSLGVNVTRTETQTKINQDLKPFSILKSNVLNGYNNISGPSYDLEQEPR